MRDRKGEKRENGKLEGEREREREMIKKSGEEREREKSGKRI